MSDSPVALVEDYAIQLSLDRLGLAHDVALELPRRVRTYNPTYGTAGVSSALARLAGWTWGHRYVVRHVLDLMGGLCIEGLLDASGRPLPVCRDTANQIAAQLALSPGTVDNALSRACCEGILGRRSGTIRMFGATRLFQPGRARGPRVIYPGPVLCDLLDAWGRVSLAGETCLTSQ